MSAVAGVARTPGPMPGAALFVWGIWAGMLALALVYAGKFGSRLPFYDDWTLVPALTGAEPLTPAYLWAPFNEHRVPLPKLVLYALGRLSGFDFRAGMLLNVALLGGLALALLHTARRLRGHLHFADAFLPLTVLGLAQWESFLIEYALNLVGSTVVASAYLMLLAGSGPRVSPGRAAGMAACLVLLPLFGANGLVLVPALALFPALVGARHCRAADAASRRQGWLTLGLVAAALLLCGVYLVGFPHSGKVPKPSAVLACILPVLSMLGGAYGLPFAALRIGVAPVIALAGGGVWLAAWWRRPEERVVLSGFLAFLLAMACLVGAVAWGRTDYLGQTPFVPRYATLLVPLGCCVYFLWGRYGGAAAGPAGQMALFLLAAVAFAPNARAAFDAARARRAVLRGFAADLASGAPPAVLAERGAGRVFPANGKDDLARYIGLLRDARAASFRSVSEDRPMRIATLDAPAALLHDMIWDGGAARAVGDRPALDVALPRAEFVYGIRLHYAYTNGSGAPGPFDLSWHRGAGAGPPGTRRPRVLLEAGAGERTVLVWVNDRIDGFRLVPRVKEFALRLSAVELLLPE